MSKAKKGGRGQKMSLADFGGNAVDDANNLDWAKDEFAPTPPTGPAQAGGGVPPMDGKGPKRDWRDFGFKAGAMGSNFREEAPVMSSKIVPSDMQAPFVAYVGNLPHNIAQDTVEEQFVSVMDVRVVKSERSTFAYVEFETRDALQNAILLTGKNVGGRKIKVDVATDAQRARLERERDGGSGRESAQGFSRDGMGSAQPTAPRMGGGGSRMGSRNASAMDLAFSRDGMGQAASPTSGGVPEFSRDGMGQAQPRTPNTNGSGRAGFGFRDRGSKPASPAVGGAPDFGGWRDSERQEQPAAAAVASPTGDKPPTFARRGEAPQRKTPDSAAKGDAGSWRDAPPAKQPAVAAADKPAEEGRGGGWRDAAPAKPAENSWRRGPPAPGSS